MVLAAVAAVSGTVNAEMIAGRVVAIADGDTLTLLDKSHQQHRVRLLGIDAPEKNQAFGQRSKQHLAALVFDRQVQANCPTVDRYQRKVCKVTINDVNANLKQVETGMAWWYRAYAGDQAVGDRILYESAEKSARGRRIGLWGDHNPIPPWEWRRAGVAR